MLVFFGAGGYYGEISCCRVCYEGVCQCMECFLLRFVQRLVMCNLCNMIVGGGSCRFVLLWKGCSLVLGCVPSAVP